MSLAVLYSRALAGMEAPLVTVETHLANGLPAFTIVGLPEAEVKEAKDRVRAALQNARISNFRCGALRSISRQPICRKKAGVSICRLRLEFLRHRASCRPITSINTNSPANSR